MKAESLRTDAVSGPSTRGQRGEGDGAGTAPALVPRISPWLLRWFHWYSVRYLKRYFHAVRLSREGRTDVDDETPLVIYLNHAAWWDPLVGLILAKRLFPQRAVYAPIEANALGRYRFMGRLGLFGIDPQTRRGARQFLRVSRAILARPGTALWITPEGRFTDPRDRPVRFHPGLAHVARMLDSGALLPLAIEYPFWEERSPEVLCRFGEPVRAQAHRGLSVGQWNALLEDRLRAVQDALAEQAIRRSPDDFESLLRGSAGVGGVYDVWRRLRARLRGEEFSPEHGGLER